MSLPTAMPCLSPPCESGLTCGNIGKCKHNLTDAARSYDEAIQALRDKAERGEEVRVFGQTVEGIDAIR